jgi:small subunit ribosomal protein S8
MDTIANMLTMITNAQAVRKERVIISYSKFKHSLAEFLVQQGWLAKVKVKDNDHKQLILTLTYDEGGIGKINGLKRVSKPGGKAYVSAKAIPYPFTTGGEFVISTSQGLKTDRKARKEGLGGELICEIW